MSVSFDLGVGAILNYKRLNYTPWHALAEFVDNSTQSYFSHQAVLDDAYERDGEGLEVKITYDLSNDTLLVVDNAMGMSLDEIDRALHVGVPPEDTSGRSEYGMGMKTAACWIGDMWTLRTKKLGDETEYSVTIDVNAIASGATDLDVKETAKPAEDHYTLIEIHQLHHRWQGRRVGKIPQYLRSMFRVDIRNHTMRLEWQHNPLDWDDQSENFLAAPDGSKYFKEFSFEVGGKPVWGWVAVLDSGSRALAGFAMIRRGRVIDDNWRPNKIFGEQEGGTNNLVNQRILGEIHLDAFIASHTKDGILWFDNEEAQVEKRLHEICEDYVVVARDRRKREQDERGPSDIEIDVARQEFQVELESGELIDAITFDEIPPEEVIDDTFKPLVESIEGRDPDFCASIGPVEVLGFLAMEASRNDPYVFVDASRDNRVLVSINANHPHWNDIVGDQGVLNYLRECTYDALAEWKARRHHALAPDTVKLFKDRFLRIAFDMETRLSGSAATTPEEEVTPDPA